MAAWLLGLLATGCAITGGPGQQPPVAPSPPQFWVRGDSGQIAIPAWTYCLPGVCADGGPPDPPPVVVSASTVSVSFSEPGWAMTATWQQPGPTPGAERPAPVATMDAGRWTIGPVGPSRPYDVTMTAKGPDGGDAYATFRWSKA